ncbi:MAG: radical SAM protein [Actinomycetota bacterium]|nr:radical SAM protein [Actinomycetota bacterium]
MTAGFGVYVHVPFCSRRCDYCAFATWTDRHHLMADYSAACVAEIEGADLPPATSVFFGGGTPSLLPAGSLAAVLAAVRRTADAEVTVECNPETVSAELFAAYRAAGVTRVSVGAQSMVSHVLAGLGRAHGPGAVARAVALAGQAGFASCNVDLIHGGAGESLADWQRTLQAVVPGSTVNARGRGSSEMTTTRPTSACWPTRCWPPPACAPTRSSTGRARPRVPPQPSLLVAGRLPGDLLRRPLPRGRPALVERAHLRALHRLHGRGTFTGGGG